MCVLPCSAFRLVQRTVPVHTSCTVRQVGNDKVELKRITLRIPAGHDLSGLTFVIRSADSTAWWRDGAMLLPVSHALLHATSKTQH